MNHTVVIPSSFFLNEAKHEYYDYRTRLVQELLQNSLDAGASRIDLNFTSTGYSCKDDGRGMTQDRMISALLTMGGSAKEVGATGGFGAAKKLLLFAHDSFTIHSNSTKVKGSGLSYQFVPCEAIFGTLVSAEYADPADFQNMDIKAANLLRKCNFKNRCKVYLNGELFTEYASARHAKTMDGFGEVYANKTKSIGNNEVSILHNGLFMFGRYVSDLERVVILDVNGKSTELFTQNRDGFKGDYRTKFDSLISELTIDKHSVFKSRPRKFVMNGIDAFIRHISSTFTITPEIQAAINVVRLNAGNYDVTQFVQAVANKIADGTSNKAVADSIVTYVKNNTSKLASDFHFDLADSKFEKVPDQFVPNTGKPKYTHLAAVWKICVREVLKANNITQNFVIGFTFDSSAIATHSKKDGVSCYMINPKASVVDEGTKEEKIMTILTTAVHEVVHSMGITYHDERFVCEFHKLLVPTLTKGLTWRQIVKAAKFEKV